MTTAELENIVARHEMQCLELKESFNVESIETACAFANSQGGYIIIGVDDKGAPSKHELRIEALRDYENKISTATEPSVAFDGSAPCLASAEQDHRSGLFRHGCHRTLWWRYQANQEGLRPQW